jgi:transcriptional regulator with XRE-family HTH domain
MFISYNLKEFGLTLRELRIKLKLTQQEVCKKSSIHVDTLRKLENGNAVPRYETLELLSRIYHVDLLELLQLKRVDKNLSEIYQELDIFLLSDNTDDLTIRPKQLLEAIETYSKSSSFELIDISEVNSFKVFLEATHLFHSSEHNNLLKAKDIIVSHMTASHNEFTIEKLDNIHYSEIEFRLISLLSAILLTMKDYTSAEKSLSFLHIYISELPVINYHLKKMLLKIACNISYCYHFQDNHTKALKSADEGIQLAIEWDTLYMLPNLYARKAIAEKLLNHANSVDSVNKCIHLLEISCKNELAIKYKEIFKSMYEIDL